MTRRNTPDTSLPTTEQTPSTMDIILPCPANSHHATIVQVLSLGPFDHRHQHFSDASSSTSPSISQGLLRNHSRNELRRRDELRDEIAWGFVPAAFRPKLGPDKLEGSRWSPRPTAADLVVSTHTHRQTSSSESGSSPSKSTTRSPVSDWATPAPSRKRQSSYTSPNDDARASIKRQVVCKAPFKRHQIDDDDNPFSVQSNGNPPDIPDFLARPYKSQQIGRDAVRMDPSTPGPRYRTKSWERTDPTSPASTLSPSTPCRRTRNVSEGVPSYPPRTDGRQHTTGLSRSSEPFLLQDREATTSRAPESPLYERNHLLPDVDHENFPNTPTRARKASPGFAEFDPTIPRNTPFSSNRSSPKTPRLPGSKQSTIFDGSLQDGSLAGSEWNLKETPHKSPASMDPLSTGRRQHQHLLASSLGSSGRAYGENDPRSATTSPIMRRDQGWILDTPSKINGRSPVTPKALSDPTDINEWMADFETPPRKAATQKDPHNIRECLFGFPPRVTEPVPSQASSQEGSFYSAQSSVIGEDDDHQKNIGQDGSEGCQGDQRNERSVGKVTDREEGQRVPSPRKPSSQAIGYDPTEGEQLFPRPQDTPSPLVQDTDQVQLSPVVSSVEHPYCAREEVPESSDDMFAEITSSAIHRAFSGKSDGSVSQNGRKSQGNRFISQRRLSRTSGDVSMHHIGSEDMEGLLEPWSLSSHGSNRLTGDGHVKHQLDQGLGDAYEDDFADLDGDHFDLHAFTQSPAKSRTIAQDAPVSIVTLDDNHETDEVNHQDGLKSDGNVIQARPAFILRPASVSSDTTAKWAKFFLDEDDDDAGMIGISEPLPGFGRFQVPSVSRPLSTQPMSDGESYVKNQNPSPRIASLRPITEEIHDATPPKFQGFGRFRGSNTFEPMAPISKEAQERAARLFDKDVSDDFSYHHTSQTTEPPKRSLPGFTNGHMKPVVPVSQEKMERWSRIFDDDDSVDVNDRSEGPAKPPPSFGGFSVASGKALPKLSESSLSKAANMLEVNDTPEVVSFSRPGQVNQFVGFSTAKNNGKTFVPITVSKAAKERALSVLEMEEPTSKPDHSSDGSLRGRISLNFNNRPSAPMKASSRNGVTPPAAPASVTSHPAPSTHMNNLKNKSLRSSASKMATALPGALKPLSRSTNQFKPPLMTNAGYGNHESIDSNMNDNNPTKPFGGLVGRKQIGKRALHPNARPTFVNPPQVQVTKVIPTQYRSLFNLEVSAERESISKFGLPQRRTPKELAGCGLPQDVIDMSLGTAKTFRLDGWGVSEAFRGLLDRGASAELLSEAWVSNHYGLIVWKLACYCRSWPDLFTLDKSLTPTTVLNQLCYRYEREINRAERSALRKVVEGDESASRHMVLCIAAIDRNANPPSVTVTDGWYVIPAVLDVHLHKAIQRGRLNVGTKLHVCQALLHGAENGGVAILEQPDAISIALHGNNTRLARWDKKLGFQRAPIQWTTRIRNILPDGGIVPGLDAVVLRKYPVVYMEKLENDTKIRRSGREEARAQEAHRSKMEKRHQEIVEEVEKELMPGLAQEEMLDRSTVEQEINARTSEMVAQMQRNVQAMFSIRVGNCHDDDSNRQEALITFWKADMPDLQEGQRVRLTSLKATKPSRDPGFEDMMQLNGTRNTISYPATAMEPDSILLTAYKPREITACADVQQLHIGAEIDLAVIVLAVSEVVNTFKKYLIVTDASRRLIVVEYHLSPISPLTSSSPPFWIKIMSKVLFANARYKIHDRKLDVDVVSCPLSYTQAVIASGSSNQGWPLYARRPLQQLHELESEDGHGDGRHGMPEQNDASLGQLIGRANAILMGMQPSL